MAKKTMKPRNNSWAKIKQRALMCDSKTLVNILQDLYEISSDNKLFLHARFFKTDVVFDRYRQQICDLIYPDPLNNRPVRVPDAVRLIRQYYRATGDTSRSVNLLLDALETGIGQAIDLGMYEEYFSRLTILGNLLLQYYIELPEGEVIKVCDRFRELAHRGKDIGWGFGDYLQDILIELDN